MYLDWESRPEDYFVVDIETDDLDATIIWCMGWENVRTRQKGMCVGHDQIKQFFDQHKGAVFVGHNIIKFDAPTIARLTGSYINLSKVVDTLVLSTLYSPSLAGGHSLEAWGTRLGNPKAEFNDWSKLSQKMLDYCQQDATVTTDLFIRLTRVMDKIGFSELSCFIQHNITYILHKQQQTGFYFDGPRAVQLLSRLRQKEADLQEEIYNAFPPVQTELGRFKQSRKKDGTYTAQYLRHREQFDRLEEFSDGTYAAFGPTSFNIGSPVQRVEKLLELGWVNRPDEVTKTGKPKPFEHGKLVPSLEEFLETHNVPEVRMIAQWMLVNGRANMVNTWLENWNEETHCIHGKLFVADTLRFRHQAPNTANVPAVRIKEHKDVHGVVVRKEILFDEAGGWTYEARDLWCARKGRTLVGTDAAGLELRMLAHYLNRDDFTDGVVNGDPHQTNADIAGITRPQAKTLIYAVCYGAGPAKIAATLGLPFKQGAAVREQFLDKLGLTDIINESKNEQSKGRVWLVDGSGVVCPSPHAALNYKLQGGGARVMALAAIFLERSIRQHGLDSLKVGDIHDEWQYDVSMSDADEHARLSVQAIRDAGEELGLNVPLDGEAKKGLTWAETH